MRSNPIFLLTAAFALSLAGCNKASGPAGAPPAPVVTVSAVQAKPLQEWGEFTGRVEAVESVEVRPRVSGHIQSVQFKAGQMVKKGDVLFVIDPRWYRAEYERRQAEYVEATVHLENADRDGKRSAKLLASRTISSEQADSVDSSFRGAQAAVLAAKAVLDVAQLDLEYTEVRAPIDGRVSRALLTTGNYVSGTAGGASLLTTLVSVDPVYVYADIDESSLLQFNALAEKRRLQGENTASLPVELELVDEQGFPHKGVIESFNNRLDAGTGTILLRAEFPNTDGRIVPGLFARIRIPTSDNQPTILVDEKAIGTDQAQKFVLAVKADNTVEYRPVTLGPAIDGQRIIRSGLQPGDRIVVNGTQRARPGMTVNPQEAPVSTDEKKTAQR